MSLQHIQKNSPRLLPKPAKFEKNPPNGYSNGYRVIMKTKCGAGGAGGAAGAGGAGSSPIHKQASLVGRLIKHSYTQVTPFCIGLTTKRAHLLLFLVRSIVAGFSGIRIWVGYLWCNSKQLRNIF